MTNTNTHKPSPLWQSILVWVILVAGIIAGYYIVDSKPASKKKEKRVITPKVNVESMVVSEKQVSLTARGVVEDSQVTQLAFQVSGKVISVSKTFEPGSLVKKNEVLATLETVEFEHSLANARVKLAQAQLHLLEVEQSKLAAEEEWRLYNKKENDKPSPLLLKEPQIALASKGVLAAMAEVAFAETNLNRASLRAPYDGIIAKRNIYVGSVVQGSTAAGEIINNEECWVKCFLPLDSLAFIQKNGKVEGAKALVTVKAGNMTVLQKTGEALKVLPRLEGQTRLAQLMIQIKEPFEVNQTNNVFLFSGLSVEVIIEAAKFNDVVVLKLEYLRDQDTLWLEDAGRLKIQPVKVLFKNEKEVVVSNGDWVHLKLITSDLLTVKEGLTLIPSDGKK